MFEFGKHRPDGFPRMLSANSNFKGMTTEDLKSWEYSVITLTLLTYEFGNPGMTFVLESCLQGDTDDSDTTTDWRRAKVNLYVSPRERVGGRHNDWAEARVSTPEEVTHSPIPTFPLSDISWYFISSIKVHLPVTGQSSGRMHWPSWKIMLSGHMQPWSQISQGFGGKSFVAQVSRQLSCGTQSL